mgnify:CR=1 FL=1
MGNSETMLGEMKVQNNLGVVKAVSCSLTLYMTELFPQLFLKTLRHCVSTLKLKLIWFKPTMLALSPSRLLKVNGLQPNIGSVNSDEINT